MAALISMTKSNDLPDTDAATFEQLTAARPRILAELGKAIVGQHEVIEQILIALFAGGHCLITGAPGLAKTLLVKSIAQIFIWSSGAFSSRRTSCRRTSRAWKF